MDFRPSSEQEMLRDSARRYFDEAPRETSRAAWARYAEFGWLAMPVAVERGGLGSSLADMAVLCEEFGRGQARESWIAGALLPARLLARSAAPAAVPLSVALAEGTQRCTAALYEPARRYALTPQLCAAPEAGGAYRLSGRKLLVADGAQADVLLVSAGIDDGKGPPRPALFAVAADAPGLARSSYDTLDGAQAADVAFDAVPVDAGARLAEGADVPAMLEAALDEARVCLCAEMLGAADRAIELTAAYLRMRKQFGRALAEFQALQHTVAEMAIEADGIRSLVYRALAALDGDGAARARAVAGCCIKALPAARWIVGTAVHLHGGIGVTREYPVGRYLLRALVAERLFGDREQQLARYLA